MVARGEIWWAHLPDPVASEPGYRRPVLIIQSDAFNRSQINTVIAVALTSNLRLADAPGNMMLSARKTRLPKNSAANVSQIITLDKQFLRKKCGRLDLAAMLKIEDGLRLVLSL